MNHNKHDLQYNNLLLFRVLLLREIDEHCHKKLFNWTGGDSLCKEVKEVPKRMTPYERICLEVQKCTKKVTNRA